MVSAFLHRLKKGAVNIQAVVPSRNDSHRISNTANMRANTSLDLQVYLEVLVALAPC